ncbi:zinc finger protein 90 [Plutella xylostella]|uniref:zinc finger protein 90 n=1 Tax=Plutella xylostella TaxID=51655 RepID=UPI002032D881|nr:zinc finger protein 90 [Plutella xylostella]
MSEICAFCLSKDRNISPVLDKHWFTFHSILECEDAQYMKFLQSECLLKFCWECRFRVESFSEFVHNAQRCVRILKQYWTCPAMYPPTNSKLSCTQVDLLEYPPFAVLSEPGDAAPMAARQHEEHNDIFKIVKEEKESQTTDTKHPAPASTSLVKLEQHSDTEYPEAGGDTEYPEAGGSDSDVGEMDVTVGELIRRAREAKKKSKTKVTRKVNSKYYSLETVSEEQALQWYLEESKHNEVKTDISDAFDEVATPHKCTICKQGFETECVLKQHSESHYTFYKCNICQYETRELSDIKLHKKTEHGKSRNGMVNDNGSDIENQQKDSKTRECKKCGATFGSLPLLRKHRAACTVFKCDFCDKSFTHRTSKYSHMDLHHKPLPEVECQICKKRFKNKYAIKSHLQKHRKESRGALYYCAACGVDYRTAILFRQHFYRNMRPGAQHRNECFHCDIRFQTPKRLQEHISTTHMKRGVYKCSHCFKSYMQKKALELHVTTKHSREVKKTRDKICDVCGKGFTSTTILKNHMRSHTGERPYRCELCPARFGHTGSLYTHVKLVHKKRGVSKEGGIDAVMFQCTACTKEFVSESRLKSHYDFFHLKKSEFTCEICNKIFISAWNLKNHRTMLHGINRTRSFPCSVCGKEFFRVDALKSHKLIHSEERTFMCSECGKTFKQQAALYTHNKLVHKGIKRPPAKSNCKRSKKVENPVMNE